MVLYSLVREGLSERVTTEQSLTEGEGEAYVNNWGKGQHAHRRKSICKALGQKYDRWKPVWLVLGTRSVWLEQGR